MTRHTGKHNRRGIIAPLAAVLMVFMLGMVAFAIDISWMVLAQTELQNSADACALAGVEPLMDNYVLYSLAGQTNKTSLLNAGMASARTKAKLYATYNAAGGVRGLTLNDSDIEFGFTDASGNYTALPTYTGYPNTIRVTLRRDTGANGSLALFFAPVIGTRNVNLTATAGATLYTGVINSFNGPAGLLPIAYDVNHWNDFLKTGKDPDGNTSKDANGNPQIQIYPSIKYKGNFGYLSLDDSHASANDMRGWVDNGASAADIQALKDSNLIPLSDHDSSKWDWNGDNGYKSTVVQAINNYEGKVFTLPLFMPKDSSQKGYLAGVGQGSHYDYNIVQFVGVKIMNASQDNRDVIVQPAAVIEPNAVFDPSTIVPMGTSSTLITTFTTPKLTR